jgi:RNA polymerase sigma factor (sigma-70 family)
MTPGSLSAVLRHLHGLAGADRAQDLTDGDLLEQFHSRREEAAFAVLVRRHGPMVWGVCRRLLHDAHLAEDAFQATFLVLLRRSRAIRKSESLGSWLHGVAYRVAAKARAQAETRRARERRFVEMPRHDALDDLTWRELRAVLDEELSRLPEKYRAAVVLCHLEGKTHEEAARQLGCPRTSLSSRLGRARALLRQRLARRGLTLSLGVLTVALAERAAVAELPARLLLSTVRAVPLAAAGQVTAVSSQALTLAKGVLQPMSPMKLTVAVLLVLALAAGVTTALVSGRQPPAPPPPQEPRREQEPALPVQEGPPSFFRDMTPESGVDFTYRNGEEAEQHTVLESLGGGVALLDYDGDGVLDVFLPGGGYFAGADKTEIKGHPCKLYKNLGNWKFKDVTKEVGLDRIAFYTHGCAVADYDRDGWPDLLVTGYRQVALFHNESDGKGGRRFVDVTKKAGLVDDLWSTSAAWADLDGDGYPDLYVCHYLDWSFRNHPACSSDGKTLDICPPKQFKAQPHKVYRNHGDGTFTDVSKEAGLRGDGKGLGVVVADVDDDGKPDLYVANDTTANFLYLNRSTPGRIRFDEVGLAAGVAFDALGRATGSKGVAAGDYDNTGRPALLVTTYEGEILSLYHNQGKDGQVRFHYVSQKAGLGRVGQNTVGWGCGFLDLDQDGWPNLFIANGHVLRHPAGKATLAQRPLLLRNEGGKFTEISARGGPYFGQDHRGRGVAVGDLDNDGRIDLVISHLNEPVVLLRNESKAANHWLGVELSGKNRRDVTGARLTLEVEGLPLLTRYVQGGGSFASAGDRRQVFGLGAKARRVGKLTVRWPGGKEQTWEGLEVDRYWRLVEEEKDAHKPGGKGTGTDKP